jgi:hypothetical protein
MPTSPQLNVADESNTTGVEAGTETVLAGADGALPPLTADGESDPVATLRTGRSACWSSAGRCRYDAAEMP